MSGSPQPGSLVGSGRTADVYQHGPDQVLRRYREPRDTEREVAGMDHARRHGFPVAEAKALSDTDIVMQRLRGPTMLDQLGRRPWQIRRLAALLASLHRRLHDIDAPDWLPAPVGEGRQLLHLDLHPDNVILTPNGPSVIDWPNVARGPGCGDVAYTWIILATAAHPAGGVEAKLVAGIGRRAFMELFLRQFDRAERAEIERLIPICATVRLTDRALPEVELAKIRPLTRSKGRS
jgi:aminoglycoside phosphotransferase (APT) family kinase protein